MRRMRIFLSILVVSVLLHSVESHLPEIENVDQLDVGPLYNIVRNPNADFVVKSSSVKDGRQFILSNLSRDSSSANIIEDNYNKSKDKFLLDVETGKELVHYQTNFLIFAESITENTTEVKGYTEKYVTEIDDNSKISNDSKTASNHRIYNWFNNRINGLNNHGPMKSFKIKPRETVVTLVYSENDKEGNTSVTTSFFRNDNLNHRISRRKAVPERFSSLYDYEARAFQDDYSSTEDDFEGYAARPNGCDVPEEMDHSELICTAYPSYTECKQTCVVGYKFRSSKRAKRLNTRTQKCEQREKEWKPSRDFSDCVPAVNCDIKLTYGKAKCIYNSVKRRPYCYISCTAKKDTDVTKRNVFKCSRDDSGEPKWDPKLPSCANIAPAKDHRQNEERRYYQPKRGKAFVMKELEGKMDSE